MIVRDKLTRAWKRLPEPLRRAGHLVVQGIERGLTPARVAARWRRGRPAGGPVFVAGLFGSASGVGQSARLFSRALDGAGVPVSRVDVGPALRHPGGLDAASDAGSGEGVLVSHLNPPELLRWLGGEGAIQLRGKRHVGFWFWELPEAPPDWRKALRYVDEVWCQSRFTAEAVAALGPDVPVRVVPHPVFATPRPEPDRQRFGIPTEGCAVLAGFDLRSTTARKNPSGALEAYLRACPEPDPERALLICKLRGGEADPAAAARLAEVAARRSDVRLLTEELSVAEMAQLTASVDVVLSLHRAEGFGLMPAEAIWLGKPVVATGWSGVMDFLDAESACLVDYTLAPVVDPQGIYVGGFWAEPDLEHAAEHLRRLIADPAARTALGVRARDRADAVFSREAWLERVLPLLGLGPEVRGGPAEGDRSSG